MYPAGRETERLAIVARYLDCVEVDASFYRPPLPRLTARWAVTTPPRFRFLAKAWQRFTHQRDQRWTRAEFDLFVTGLQPLRERLDAVLFQFPWSFRHHPANRDWLRRIAEEFAGWPVAVEVRHDSWMGDDVQEFFCAQGLTFCNIDHPALNHCLPPTTHATTATGYYRLHGQNAVNWFKEQPEVYGGRYDYLYSEAELDEVASRVRQLAAQTRKTLVVFNNHKDAKAFANALQLKARLAPEPPVAALATLVAAFPVLRGRVREDHGPQLALW